MTIEIGTITDEALNELIEAGDCSAICHKPTAEEYGRPIACEGCGGEAVLEEDDDDQ